MLTAIEKDSIYGAHLETERLLLTPFSRQYLQQYARWLSNDATLCADTATDTLNSTFDTSFCHSVQHDPDKLLFIFLDKAKLASGVSQTECMIGDIGCHFVELQEETENSGLILEQNQPDSYFRNNTPSSYALEITLMIAEPQYRRQGFAFEVAEYFIDKVLPKYLPIPSHRFPYYIAKIKQLNEPSVRLFKKLNFKPFKELPIFDEVWLTK
jgi:RimJ/RimL family protein N-acetyltransferase